MLNVHWKVMDSQLSLAHGTASKSCYSNGRTVNNAAAFSSFNRIGRVEPICIASKTRFR